MASNMASNMAGKDSSERTILLDFKGLKKECSIRRDERDKVSLVERVFQTRLQTFSDSSAPAIVSLQRFDPEWEDLVDIDIAQIKDRDKIKVLVIENSRASATCTDGTSKAARDSNVPEHGVEQLISNLEDQRRALDYKFSIAQATLESLKVAPRERGPAGKHSAFTCSSCHYKGHRANNCMLHPCRGYFECGQLSLHREHKDHLKQAEVEVKEIQRQLKRNTDEMENYKLLKERTRTNFFAVTRQKLQCCNPIKYSNRTALDNDLRVLAAAMNHRVPSAGEDLERIIENYKNKAKSMKSVQNDNAHHTYGDPPSMFHKQSVNHKSPITIHNQWAPFNMSHSPPYYGTQSPYMYHRTPSPGPSPLTRSPYMGPRTSSPGPRSPFWHSSTGNVNYRSQNLSSVRNRSPHFYSKPRGGYYPKPQQTHHSKKRLRYDPGREYRESLKVVAESKKASTVGSDDETQDDSLTESPVPKKSNTGAEASVASMVENNDESQSLNEESQPFNFESWKKEQIAVARKISSTDP